MTSIDDYYFINTERKERLCILIRDFTVFNKDDFSDFYHPFHRNKRMQRENNGNK